MFRVNHDFELKSFKKEALIKEIKELEAFPSYADKVKELKTKLEATQDSLLVRDSTIKAMEAQVEVSNAKWAKSMADLHKAEVDGVLAQKADAFVDSKAKVGAAAPKVGEFAAPESAAAEAATAAAETAAKTATRTWGEYMGSFFSHKTHAAPGAKAIPVERTAEFRAAQDAARAYSHVQRASRALEREQAYLAAMENKDMSYWQKTYRTAAHKAAGTNSYLMQSPRSFASWLDKKTNLPYVAVCLYVRVRLSAVCALCCGNGLHVLTLSSPLPLFHSTASLTSPHPRPHSPPRP